MKIGTRISWGIGFILILLAINALLGIIFLHNSVDGYSKDVTFQWEIMEISDGINADILQARRHTKAFLIQKDMKYVPLTHQHLATAKADLQEIISKNTDTNIDSLANEMISKITAYGNAFDTFINAIVSRGLTPELGVQGESRRTSQDVLQVLKDSGFVQGEILFLTSMEHLKDYMLSGLEAYLYKTRETTDQLKEKIKSSTLSQKVKEDIHKYLGQNGKSLDLLIEKDKEIAQLMSAMQSHADQGMDLAGQIETAVGENRDRITAKIYAASRRAEMILLMVSCLAVSSGMFFAFFFSRSISIPISEMMSMIQKLESGNFDVRLTIERKDEIGTLADTLNKFSATLLEDTNRVKHLATLGELSAGVAHEINNPNAIILLNSQIITDAVASAIPILDEYYRSNGDFLLGKMSYSRMRTELPILSNNIKMSSDRIRSIVEELKDYVSRGQIDLSGMININNLLKMVVKDIVQLNTIAKNGVILDLDEDIPSIRGNSQRIEQVFVNLLNNAVQSISSLKVNIIVKTRYEAETNLNIVEITDNGSGIAPENLIKITDPFFTTRRTEGGIGLGLSVSNRIIKEHGGTLKFESKLECGTTAKVTLCADKTGSELTIGN